MHISRWTNVLRLSLLSNTGWAVRQPPYKSARFVTPCLETWAGLPQPRRHKLLDPHWVHILYRTTVSAPANNFSCFCGDAHRMASPRTVICLLRNDLRLCDNEVRRSLLATSCDYGTRCSAWALVRRVVVALNVYFLFCGWRVISRCNCVRMSFNAYWVSCR